MNLMIEKPIKKIIIFLRSYFQLFRKPFNIERTHRIFNSILAFLEKVMVKMNNISRKRS